MSYKTDLYGGAALRRLREIAPSQDRDHPMFHPVRQPGHPLLPPKPKRVVTLEMLDATCGQYADAAKAEAQWLAISSWLRKRPQLPNDLDLTRTVVELAREADRCRLGYPGHSYAIPALSGLKPELRREVEEVAAETIMAWVKAQRPRLSAYIIRSVSGDVQEYLNSASDTINSKDNN